jgi:hypothetical protein
MFMEIAKQLTEWGFTPGAYGIYGILAAILFRGMSEWRENRKLSSTDRQARREGFEKQVNILQDENRSQREDMVKLREEYDGYRRMCQQETDDLRGEIRRLETEQAGYKRRLDAQALELAKLRGIQQPTFSRVAGKKS